MKIHITTMMGEFKEIRALQFVFGQVKFRLSLWPFKARGSWCIKWIIENPKATCSKRTTTYGLNRFPYWRHRIWWMCKKLYLKLTKKLYLQCHGCGEGISKWKIRDPNHGSGNKYWNCCDDCVNFYDRRWSAMKIIGWKHKKPVCVKK